jgi:hypothetical protein
MNFCPGFSLQVLARTSLWAFRFNPAAHQRSRNVESCGYKANQPHFSFFTLRFYFFS